MESKKLASLLIRIGLSFGFFYAAFSSFLNPDDWIGFFPLFLRNLIPVSALLWLFSSYQIILALWLLWGKFPFSSALAASLTIFGIIITNLGVMGIVFRDVSILLAGLALAVLNRES